MKDVAALVILVALALARLVSLLLLVDESSRWQTHLSPETGICYEVRKDAIMFGWGVSMSPVDSSYCEDE